MWKSAYNIKIYLPHEIREKKAHYGKKNYRQFHHIFDSIKSYFILSSERTVYAMNTLNETVSPGKVSDTSVDNFAGV